MAWEQCSQEISGTSRMTLLTVCVPFLVTAGWLAGLDDELGGDHGAAVRLELAPDLVDAGGWEEDVGRDLGTVGGGRGRGGGCIVRVAARGEAAAVHV